MSHRFFRAASDVYESVRTTLDNAWSLPAGSTCIEPAASAPRDSNGLVYVGIPVDACEWAPANEILPMLLNSGQVQEVSEEQYRAALPAPVLPDVIPPPQIAPSRPRRSR